MNPKLFLFILFVVTMGLSAYFVLPRRPAPELARDADVDLVDSKAESADHEDGYKAGQYFARQSAQGDLSEVELKALSAGEFKKSQYKNAVDWQSGFVDGYKQVRAKPPEQADTP